MKTIYRIDASGIKGSLGCTRKLMLTCILGFGSGKLLNDIEYGSAFHVFKETLKISGNKFIAFQAGSNYFRSRQLDYNGDPNPDFIVRKNKEWLDLNHLSATMMAFIEHVGEKFEKDNFKSLRKPDGTPRVEQVFEIPLYECDTFVIMLVGTIDELGQFLDGCYAIGDTKTTAMFDVPSYMFPYKLSGQLVTYLWAVRWHIRHEVGLMELKGKEVRAFIDGVFLSKTQPVKFVRSEAFKFSDSLLDEFEVGLSNIVADLVRHINNGTLPYREGILTDACSGKFKDVCPFFAACSLPEDSWDTYMGNYFVKKEYNPILFRKIK